VAQPNSILIVAPVPPPSGGMALQARLLERLLKRDSVPTRFLPSNFALPGKLSLCERVPGLRTLLRFLLIWGHLRQEVRQAAVMHVFAASWLYFFVVVCPAILMGRLYGTRTVLNYRGGDARRFFKRWGWLVKPVVRRADVITTPSAFLGEVIHDVFAVPVVIVPNILDLSAFTFRRRTDFRPNILVSRNLEKMYNIECVLQAFRQIQEWHPDARLWIAGTGSEEQRLRSLVAEWDLPNVRFLGNLSHEDLPAVYQQCDIAINASHIDNFPAALLEASAAGLTVVSTATGGIPFIYENDVTALLVEQDDWRALAAAVDRIVRNGAVAAKMTLESRTMVEQFTWENVRQTLFTVYGFALEESGSSRLESQVSC
jgi:glycosyltransferase involved in cell wall biosynthesis